MKERPILMSAPMVLATLKGLKTQTRRVVRPQPRLVTSLVTCWDWPRSKHSRFVCDDRGGLQETLVEHAPYGRAGDRLWVRETWAPLRIDGLSGVAVAYRASCPDDSLDVTLNDGSLLGVHVNRWTPAIHMPREASRLQLEITEVRAQRLHEITDTDAYAEGIEELDGSLDELALCRRAKAMGECAEDARVWFAELWDAINAARGYSWDSNPWVWCLTFRRVEQ